MESVFRPNESVEDASIARSCVIGKRILFGGALSNDSVVSMTRMNDFYIKYHSSVIGMEWRARSPLGNETSWDNGWAPNKESCCTYDNRTSTHLQHGRSNSLATYCASTTTTFWVANHFRTRFAPLRLSSALEIPFVATKAFFGERTQAHINTQEPKPPRHFTCVHFFASQTLLVVVSQQTNNTS